MGTQDTWYWAWMSPMFASAVGSASLNDPGTFNDQWTVRHQNIAGAFDMVQVKYADRGQAMTQDGRDDLMAVASACYTAAMAEPGWKARMPNDLSYCTAWSTNPEPGSRERIFAKTMEAAARFWTPSYPDQQTIDAYVENLPGNVGQ